MVLIVNVIEVEPAGILTVAGTVAAARLLDRDITRPPDGATDAIVTVPVLDAPPVTLDGLNVNDETTGAFTATVVVFVVDPLLAETVELISVGTANVVIENVAVSEPDSTVTEFGTRTLGLLELNATTNPSSGAFPVKLTVPVVAVPPTTLDGLMLMMPRRLGLIAKETVSDLAPKLAVIFATVCALTVDVNTVKDAVSLP